jgi:pimeloyl-ACP methyl ester carboxylesterase
MIRLLFAFLAVTLCSLPAVAEVKPFPSSFKTQEIAVDGATLHVRIGGSGPAVVLLHGFGDTGDMWEPLAAQLVKEYTVIVPDLRGMGLSSHPETGYEKKNQAHDIATVLDTLKITKADFVTHDIGIMVGYAFAAQYPERVTGWVVMDAPLPGIGHWDEIIVSPALWHFSFRGPDVERLVAGRERIYLDRFYNELSATPSSIDDATRDHYAALYGRPDAMHDAFKQFGAFTQDAIDNKAMLAKGGRLWMPVLAIGGDKSFGAALPGELLNVANNVSSVIIINSGHWLMEEQPVATMAAIRKFLSANLPH